MCVALLVAALLCTALTAMSCATARRQSAAIGDFDWIESGAGALSSGDPDLERVLLSRLADEFASLGVDPSRAEAAAPHGTENAVFDLTLQAIDPDGSGESPPTGIRISFSERLVGDYDQNGEVGVPDITPIANAYGSIVSYDPPSIHNGIAGFPSGMPQEEGGAGPNDPPAYGSGAYNWRLARIDGDGSGEIGIPDITPIAQHYMERLSGYRIYRKAPGETGYTRMPDPLDAGSTMTLPRDAAFQRTGGTMDDSRPVLYTFDDPVTAEGQYSYYVTAHDPESGADSAPSNIAKLTLSNGGDPNPPSGSIASAFGIFGSYAQEYQYFKAQLGMDDEAYWDWVDAHFANLGAHWTRSNLQLTWDLVQPNIGDPYDWNNEMKSDGVATHVYASPADVNWLGVFHEGVGRGDLRNPIDYPDEYSVFVRAAVERYDGDGVDDASTTVRVKYWQCGNEEMGWTGTGRTVDDYVEFVRLIRNAALEADSEAKIVLIAPTDGFVMSPFLDDVIQALAPAHEFDVIDIHHWGIEDNWEMTLLPQLTQILSTLGLDDVEIWSCEHGTWAGSPTGQSSQTEEEQARSLIKRYVWNRAHGLDKLFWNNLVEWINFADNPGSIFNSMGLISDGASSGDTPDRLNTERVSYWAYKSLAAKTDNGIAELVGEVPGVHNESTVYAYGYRRIADDAIFYIVWSESGDTEVTMPVTEAAYHAVNLVTDRFGAILDEFDLTAVGGSVTFTVGSDPLLIEPGGGGTGGGAQTLDIRLPSDGAGTNGTLAVRVFAPAPGDELFPDGAPVLVDIPGGLVGNQVLPQLDSRLNGFILVSFAFPGSGIPPNNSDGVFDARGANCIAAVRDAILFAQGDITDADGATIVDLLNCNALTDGIGIHASSYGGVMAIVTLSQYGELLDGVDYIIGLENPTNGQVVMADTGPGGNVIGNQNRGRFINPEYRGWGAQVLDVDMDAIAWDGVLQMVYLERGGQARFDVVPADGGGMTSDLNGDGRIGDGEDWGFGFWDYAGKHYRSLPVIDALYSHGVFAGDPPPVIPTLAEAQSFW